MPEAVAIDSAKTPDASAEATVVVPAQQGGQAAQTPSDVTPASTTATGSENKPDAPAQAAASADPPAPVVLNALPAGADPLTPPPEDTGPTRAPGAREHTATVPAAAAVDPFIETMRSRLAAWPESRAKAEQSDLAALRAYYAEHDATRIWTMPDGLSPRAEAVRKAVARAGDWGLDAGAFNLPAAPAAGSPADTVADAEIRFGLEVLKYARHARGGRVDPGAISSIIDMRPRPYEPLSVIQAIADAPAADAYLEGLHPKHAGFVALKLALAKLHAEAHRRPGDERRIIINMERWRWLPDHLGEFYVWDNVPEQITRVIHGGKQVHHARIVVGKPATPTPIFSMPMRFIVFHPTWGIPDGIKSNELAPRLRRAQANSSGWFFSDNDGASRFLRSQQLRVYAGGREINPDAVNWASTDARRYTFVQAAGASNVLGVVKFRFPNKHDVYMHDTTERNLFSSASRVFSHGCMRVENPLKLAEVILAYDKGWSRGRIDQILAGGTTTDVTLDKKVNVHITYFTATADSDGKVHGHSDVYGMDSRLASALAGRSVVLSSAHASQDVAPEAAETRPATPRKAASKPARRPASTAKAAPAPRPWNPFPTQFGN